MALLALIPAAGSGSRVALQARKQYAPLAGRPMLWHAIRAVSVPRVETIFVVLAADDADFKRHDWRAFGEKLVPLYCGGQTRRDSVFNGLVASQANADDWVLVHDAARPCLAASDVEKLIAECEPDAVGGILATPVAETVKRAANERIAGTEDRRGLWLAHTPQMFRAGLLMQALRAAAAPVTDEASAVEQLGLQPKLVSGRRDNLKVTWPEDLAVADALLARKK